MIVPPERASAGDTPTALFALIPLSAFVPGAILIAIAILSDGFVAAQPGMTAASTAMQFTDAAGGFVAALVFPFLLLPVAFLIEPTLELSRTGVKYAGLQFDWTEVGEIAIQRVHGEPQVFLFLREPQRFLRSLPKYARRSLNARFSMTGNAAIRLNRVRGMSIEALRDLCESLQKERGEPGRELSAGYEPPRYSAPISPFATLVGAAPLCAYALLKWHQVVHCIFHPLKGCGGLALAVVASLLTYVVVGTIGRVVKARNPNFDPLGFLSLVNPVPLPDPNDTEAR